MRLAPSFVPFLCLAACTPETSPLPREGVAEVREPPAQATPAPVAPTVCEASSGAPDWSLSTLWTWDGVARDPSYRHVALAPVTGDLDGDGHPEVVAVALSDESPGGLGYLVVLEGATGREILAIPDVYGLATRLVVHDLDGDGDDEVLAESRSELVALDLDGVVWSAPACPSNHPAAADLDGDGDVEVVNAGCGILDGGTGAIEVAGWGPLPFEVTELVDIDGDGLLDITLGADVRDATGAWIATLPPGTERTVGVEGGPSPSFVALSTVEVRVLNESLWQVGVVDDGAYDLPRVCSADVDHDGEAEVILPAENDLSLHELDGAPVWSAAEPRSGGYPGTLACTVVDLDADGCLEVVWPQDGAPRVYDAATGHLRTPSALAETATAAHEPQPVVDLDGDGALDLVVAGQSRGETGPESWTGVRAFTEPSGAWIGPGR